MASLPLAVRAKLKPNSGKGNAIDGTLTMTNVGFTWVPLNPSTYDKLDVKFESLKSFRSSKETPTATSALLKFSTDPNPAVEGGFLFVFSSFADRDKCKDHYSACKASTVPAAAPQSRIESSLHSLPSVPSAPSLTSPSLLQQKRFGAVTTESDSATPPRPHSVPPTSPSVPHALPPSLALSPLALGTIQKRQEVLQNDAELRALHSQLVLSGILTEEEFWAGRKEKLETDNDKIRKRQKRGVSSSMMADVRPVIDGRTNTVSFSLTPEVILQVFAEKPAVHKAFLELVPSKMDEKTFWAKYCRAELLLQSSRRGGKERQRENERAVEAEAEEDEAVAVFVNEDEEVEREKRRRVSSADPTVNLFSDANDAPLAEAPSTSAAVESDPLSTCLSPAHSHSLFNPADASEGRGEIEEKKRKTRSLPTELNRHSAVVLEGRKVAIDGLESMKDTMSLARALEKAKREKVREEKRKGVHAAGQDEQDGSLQTDLVLKERLKELQVLDDLKGSQNSILIPLNLRDNTIDVQNGEALSSDSNHRESIRESKELPSIFAIIRSDLEAEFRAMKGVRNWKKETLSASSKESLQDFEKSVTVAPLFSSSLSSNSSSSSISSLSQLPKSLSASIQLNALALKEVLKHFWICFPIISPGLLAKAERHKQGISSLYDKLEKMKADCSASHRHLLSLLLQPLFQAMDAAIAHFDADCERRKKKKSSVPLSSKSAGTKQSSMKSSPAASAGQAN